MGDKSKIGMLKSAAKFAAGQGGEPGASKAQIAGDNARAAGEGFLGAATKVYEMWPRIIARGIQFIVALIAAGCYGGSLNSDDKTSSDAFWYFALFVAGASCITAIVYNIPFVPSAKCFAWDFTLAVLWIATFGVFATMFLKAEGDEHEGVSVSLMHAALWVDVICCLMWLITGAWGVFRTFIVEKAGEQADKVQGWGTKKVDGFEMKARDKVADTIRGKSSRSASGEVSPSQMEQGFGNVPGGVPGDQHQYQEGQGRSRFDKFHDIAMNPEVQGFVKSGVRKGVDIQKARKAKLAAERVR